MTMLGEAAGAEAPKAPKAPAQEVDARPIRTCVGCRAGHAQERLLAFRLDGARVTPALSRRLRAQGRCAYLCPRRACLDRAIKRRAFTRAFSSRRTARTVESLDATAADALWAACLDQLRREIERIDRSAANPHAQPRRRGLARLLFELSSQPVPPERRPRSNGQGGSPIHG